MRLERQLRDMRRQYPISSPTAGTGSGGSGVADRVAAMGERAADIELELKRKREELDGIAADINAIVDRATRQAVYLYAVRRFGWQQIADITGLTAEAARRLYERSGL